jgi:DNA modification methylase
MGEHLSLSSDEERVLALLGTHTYDQVRELTGWSRGRIYQLALRTGARKTESRIRERHEERRKRQAEVLASIVNQTVTADVLDFLDGIPDESVQLHVTSVPYNVGKRYGDCAHADSMAFTFYYGWLLQIVSEMVRTLKPGGVLALQTGKTRDWTDRLMPLDVLLFDDIRRAGLTFQNRVVWTVPHGLTPKHRLADRHETLLIFSKGDTPTFNPNAARFAQKQPDKRAFKGPNKGGLSGHPYGASPTDVWADLGNVGHNHPERKHGAHPAQFPVGLVKRAILLYSIAGDLVCDCFCGSGTSMVGAIETGRNFVGADLFYEDLRARRVANAKPDLFCPLPGVTDESVAVWQAEARRVAVSGHAFSEERDRAACQDLFGDVMAPHSRRATRSSMTIV